VTTPAEQNPDALTDVENSLMVVVPSEESDNEPSVEAALDTDGGPIELDGIEGDPPTGAMIALIPSQGNIDRLAVEDGEHPDQLHCTVLYLGEAADIPDDVFAALIEEVVAVVEEAQDAGPVVAEGFNVSLFNPHRDDRDTCVVLGLSGDQLSLMSQQIRARVLQRLESMSFEIPAQHEPWVPHVTLAYTDDHSLVERFADRTGDVTFDRVRVVLGDDVYDIDLDLATPVESPEENFSVAMADSQVVTATEGVDMDGEITEEPVEETSTEPGSWSGVLVVEGVESGDGRMFSDGSLKAAPLPLPLMWQKATDEGHKTAVQVGRIDDVWREGNQVWGSGVFDLKGVDGQEAYRQVEDKFLRGVSVDVDSVKNSDVELIFPKMSGDEDDLESLFSAPDVTVFHHGRLRGATLVQFPAFVEASISLTGGDVVSAPEALEASLEALPIADRTPGAAVAAASQEPTPESATLPNAVLSIQESGCAHNALIACGCGEQPSELSQAPDPALFENPRFTGPTAFTVDGDRVYGHAALRGTCHTGFAGQCVTMPQEGTHDYFLLGETLCSDGTTVATGTITLGTGHAGTDGKVTPMDAIKHYDHTGTVVADIVTGEDEFGLWFSGALRSDLHPAKVRSLRAAKLSGDWRKFGNKLRLVALLAVNVPGFPVPRLRTAVHNGRQVALVAAGINPVDAQAQEKQRDQNSFRTVLDSLACRIGRDPETRMSELKSHVHGR